MDAATARQRRGKHVSGASDNDTTIEGTVFSVPSVPRLYNEGQLGKYKRLKLGGGQAYDRSCD
jgi:hypothetical protein